MVARSESESVKRIKSRQRKHALSVAAVEQYTADKAVGGTRGTQQFASADGASHSTIRRHADGGRTIDKFNKQKRLLNEEENTELVKHIQELAATAFPPDRSDIKVMANAIIKAHIPSFGSVGKNWVSRFLDQNSDELKSYWSSPLDRNHCNNMSPTNTKDFFDAYEHIITTHDIPVENRYAFDETNIQFGIAPKRRVIGGKGHRTQHACRDGNRESLTFVPFICGDGTALKPLVIFKAQRWNPEWGRSNPLGASLAISGKGYTDNDIALKMLVDFDRQTKGKNDQPRLLVIDGHGSHCSQQFVEYARRNHIYIATYAPHTTHEMQGLDKVHFALFKRCYAAELERLLRDTDTKVTKANFLEIITPVYEKTFTPELNKQAWKVTGLIPFNRAVITPDRMAPSSNTSTHLEAPTQLESPYRAIIHIARGISSSQAACNGESGTPLQSEGPVQIQTEPSTTEDHNPFLVPSACPAPVSPTRIHTALREAFGETSASFLVDHDEPFDSTTPIPPLRFDPWPAPPVETTESMVPQERSAEELLAEVDALKKKLEASNERNARTQAKLVLQALYAARLKGKLYSRESAKKVNRQQLLSQRFARHLTSDEFFQALVDEEAARAVEQSAAERKRAETAKKKVLAKWRKERGERRAEQWQVDLEEWQDDVDEWETEGRHGKKPVKPKMPPLETTPEHLKAPLESLGDEEPFASMDIDEQADSDSEEEG